MRSVMRACIGSNRAPDGRYAEIDLPASPYRLLNALDEIGIKSTKEIVYQEILNYGSFGYLEPHFDEYTMLEELNALAQKLAVFDRVDSIAFEGLVKMAEQKPEPFGVKELINFAHSTESCHVVSDVFDEARCKILCKRFSTKSRMALESRADSGLNPLITESHGGQSGMRAGTA